jgi:hypothetical protein
MKKWLTDILYNLDRTIASMMGAPPQETISSELARHDSNPVDDILADSLDKVDPNHVEAALAHATLLDSVDNGQEK